MDERTQELKDGLERVQSRIERACDASGRDVSEVTLIVVTKFFPADDVVRLARLGVRDVGENRDQEALPKSGAVAEALGEGSDTPAPRWHFIGQAQSNKANRIARYADVVHSLDRPRIVHAFDRAVATAREAGHRGSGPMPALVQVDLGEGLDAGRGGVMPDQVMSLCDDVAAAENLSLAGLMAVAPLGAAPKPAFQRLAQLADQVRCAHPEARWLSAGMSSDLEDAVALGATHLRVGSAILGQRP